MGWNSTTLTQTTESIEQLGIKIQHLGRKAFPSIVGKDFDRLLKGRFYQALLVKWQRKLGPDESFFDLLARARTLENFEKQYAVSAEVQSGGKRSYLGDYRPRPRDVNPPREKFDTGTTPRGQINCYLCNELGHFRRDCPLKTESPGRSKSSTNAAVEASDGPPTNLHFPTPVEELSEAQLERNVEETELPGDRAQASASEEKADVVGPVVTMDVNIEGIPISAMIDTGAIISRYTLHAVVKSTGQEVPRLETPMVRLYGKDGQRGGRELVVTAQVEFRVSVNDKSVCVPMLVQPDSEQACLLGMNAIPLLGIMLAHDNGKPIYPPTVAMGNNPFPQVFVVKLTLLVRWLPHHRKVVWLKPLCPPLSRMIENFYLNLAKSSSKNMVCLLISRLWWAKMDMCVFLLRILTVLPLV